MEKNERLRSKRFCFKSMIKIFLTSISFIVGLSILTLVVFIVGLEEIANMMARFSFWGIIPLIVLTVITNFVSAIKWQYTFKVMGVQVGLWPLFKAWLIGYAMSYMTPVAYIGGEFFRGYALKEKYGVPWVKSMASIVVEKITESVVWISVIFLGTLIFLTSPHPPVLSRFLSASLLGMLFFGGALALVFIFVFRKKSILYGLILKPFGLEKSQSGKFLSSVEKEFMDFFAARNQKHLFWVLKVSLIKYLFFWARNVLLIYYLAGVVSVSGGIMSVGFLQLSYIFPLPAALGAQEGLLSAVFSGLGYETGFGAALSILMRIADMIMVGAGIYIMMKWGLGKFVFHILKLFKIKIQTEEL